MTRAPWQVTTLVASLPVLVLGLGTALAHMLRADASTADLGPDQLASGPLFPGSDLWTTDQPPDPDPPGEGDTDQCPAAHSNVPRLSAPRLGEAKAAADVLLANGQRVSRRSLRAAGVRGSNAELGEIAQRLRADGHVHGDRVAA